MMHFKNGESKTRIVEQRLYSHFTYIVFSTNKQALNIADIF